MKLGAVKVLRLAGWGLYCALVIAAGLTLPCFATGKPAPSSTPPQVVLDIEPCLSVDTAQVRHLLAIELGAQLLDSEPPLAEQHGLIRARVGCREVGEGTPPLVELHVDDGVTGKELSRAVDLSQQDPAVQPRLIAVALAELVFASWAELLVTPRPAVQPVMQPPPAATRAASSDAVARKLPSALPSLGVHGAAIGTVLFLFSGAPVLAGGGVRLGGDHAHHLGWDFDVSALHGVSSTAFGNVAADLLSSRSTLLLHYRLPHLLLRGGAGLRIGTARLAGFDAVMTGPRTTWALWGGPIVGAGITAAAARLRIDLGFEGGYLTAPFAEWVHNVRTVPFGGPWLGMTLGLGLLLH